MFTVVSLIVNGTLSRPTTLERSNRQRTFCVGLVKNMIMANQNPGLFSLTAGIHMSLTDILLQQEAMMKVRSCIFVFNDVIIISWFNLWKSVFHFSARTTSQHHCEGRNYLSTNSNETKIGWRQNTNPIQFDFILVIFRFQKWFDWFDYVSIVCQASSCPISDLTITFWHFCTQ